MDKIYAKAFVGCEAGNYECGGEHCQLDFRAHYKLLEARIEELHTEVEKLGAAGGENATNAGYFPSNVRRVIDAPYRDNDIPSWGLICSICRKYNKASDKLTGTCAKKSEVQNGK